MNLDLLDSLAVRWGVVVTELGHPCWFVMCLPYEFSDQSSSPRTHIKRGMCV